MRLTFLDIRELPRVEPGRLEFGPGLNLIVGPNGTGKTRLLEVLTALARGQPLALGAEAMDLSWGAEAGEHRLLAELQVRWSELALADRSPRAGAPGSSLPEFECRWSMSAQLSGPLFPSGRTWEGGGSLRGPQPALLQAQASGQASWGLRSSAWADLPAKADQADLRALAELVDPSGPGLLDEGIDVFRAMGDPAEGRSTLAPHPPLVSIRWISDDTWEAAGFDALPRWCLRLTRDASGAPVPRRPVAPDAGWACHGLQELLRVAGFDVELKYTSSNPSSRGEKIDHYAGLRFWATLHDGSVFDQDGLSFGEKRLLTYLWHLDCNPAGPVLVDELANGLHHAWLRHCVEALGERQAFFSSQNPLLLDMLDMSSPEATRQHLLCCAASTPGRAGRWRWANPSAALAAEVHAAAERGFLHGHDILRGAGLW